MWDLFHWSLCWYSFFWTTLMDYNRFIICINDWLGIEKIFLYTHTDMYTHIHICIHACAHIHMYTHTYVYTYTCIHTHTYIYIAVLNSILRCCQTFLPHTSYMLAASGVSLNGSSSKRPSLSKIGQPAPV